MRIRMFILILAIIGGICVVQRFQKYDQQRPQRESNLRLQQMLKDRQPILYSRLAKEPLPIPKVKKRDKSTPPAA